MVEGILPVNEMDKKYINNTLIPMITNDKRNKKFNFVNYDNVIVETVINGNTYIMISPSAIFISRCNKDGVLEAEGGYAKRFTVPSNLYNTVNKRVEYINMDSLAKCASDIGVI